MRPETFKVQNTKKAKLVEDALINEFDFCNDGKIDVLPKDAFGVKCRQPKLKRWQSTKYQAQQYINRKGILFIRLFVDEDDSVLFVCLENRRHIGSDRNLLNESRRLLIQIKTFAQSIESSNQER